MRLADLGDRICILGPSNSGKSTLAVAIGDKLGIPVVHLDRLYHLPETDWQPRGAGDFLALHDAAVAGDRWVMDGNYSIGLPQRFDRATGVILLDVSTLRSLGRYLRRSLLQTDRQGGLDGGHDSVKWEMIRHIVGTTPGNRQRYAEMFDSLTLPKIRLASAGAIRQCYVDWGLKRR